MKDRVMRCDLLDLYVVPETWLWDVILDCGKTACANSASPPDTHRPWPGDRHGAARSLARKR